MARPVWEWPSAALEWFRNRPEVGQPGSMPRVMAIIMGYVFLAITLGFATIAGLQFVGLWEPYAAFVSDLFWLIPGVGFGLGMMLGDALPWALPFLFWMKLLFPEDDD